ncbi:hypothetical protein K9857_01010 [Pseudomonas sp. REP124]|uniref:hypothetical protein n=1 Tax=Pseudomonas sp. REP124 TaxID=2875731 RepID=UPI001CCD318A|nr:hypothetical protein [Pseudomonas sp. REP124]MBZ9780133.1 hypothetical protein [Pseudomonas sp. REP124]
MSTKPKHSAMERELSRALTWACELAKSEIVGYEWLTHRVDYQRFPDSLIVTWVFQGESDLKTAVAGQAKARMHELTQAAFEDIGITVTDIAAHVEFDSEEGCASQHGGDWNARLNSRKPSGGKHGKRH